jgi:hypothetical protein
MAACSVRRRDEYAFSCQVRNNKLESDAVFVIHSY